jgi:exonuclease SbcD
LRILHTSDWHLGSELYTQKRTEQFGRFLDWLIATIKEEKIDALLVSGDIFDTANPPHAAEKQYYSFLASLHDTCCKTAVITAGNHDSPSKLEAAKDVLSALDVHVVAEANDDGIIVPLGNEAVVLAVPFLRSADFLSGTEGETIEEKERQFGTAVKAYYRDLADKAKREYPGRLIIAMGHCYLRGSAIPGGKDASDFMVGNLGALGSDIFPPSIAYAALGHLHTPQSIGNERIRYCGSPLPISFSEAGGQKEVDVLETKGESLSLRSIPVPRFCHLEVVEGKTVEELCASLAALVEKEPVWVEAHYTGIERVPSLADVLRETIKGSNVSLLKITDEAQTRRILQEQEQVQDLSLLSAEDLFTLKLNEQHIPEEQRPALFALFRQVVEETSQGGDDADP